MAVLSLEVAKRHLNITSVDGDDNLIAMIDAAEGVITKRCGPLEATAKTARVTGGRVLVLPTAPVVSLTTVLANGESAVNVADLYVDPASGVVEYASGATFGARFYTVTYSAGRATCPEDLLLAVKELVRHLWASQRGPTARPGSSASDGAANTLPGAGYLLPNRVSELIAPHIQPGFA